MTRMLFLRNGESFLIKELVMEGDFDRDAFFTDMAEKILTTAPSPLEAVKIAIIVGARAYYDTLARSALEIICDMSGCEVPSEPEDE